MMRTDGQRARREPAIVRLAGSERAIRPLPFSAGAEWIARAVEFERKAQDAAMRAAEGTIDAETGAKMWRTAAGALKLVADYMGLSESERGEIDAVLGAMAPDEAMAEIFTAYRACVAMSTGADFRKQGAEGAG